MSPILDLQNLTPISLEELEEEESKEINIPSENQTEEVLDIKKTKPEKKKLVIKKKINISKDASLERPNDLLLSIKDCETLSGISKVSIRKAIKEKEINYTLENGKYKISFKELLKWCYASTRRKNVFNNQGIGKYVNEWNIML